MLMMKLGYMHYAIVPDTTVDKVIDATAAADAVDAANVLLLLLLLILVNLLLIYCCSFASESKPFTPQDE